MVDVARFILEFLIVFFIVYLLSYLFSSKKIKKFDRKKMPTNIKYLVLKYNVDVVKIGYKKIYKTLNFFDSFIITFLYSITKFIDSVYLRLGVSFIMIFPLFGYTYHLIANYYKRKEE